MKDIIKIRNLNFSYDRQVVLEDINLEYSSDEFLAIIGPNGGGKSTLLKLILGLLKPQSGEIKLFGKEPSEVSKFIGYVPQFPLKSKLSDDGFRSRFNGANR